MGEGEREGGGGEEREGEKLQIVAYRCVHGWDLFNTHSTAYRSLLLAILLQ